MVLEREAIFFQEIEDRDFALVLDLLCVAPDRGLVEGNLDQARLFRPHFERLVLIIVAHGLVLTLSLIATERR